MSLTCDGPSCHFAMLRALVWAMAIYCIVELNKLQELEGLRLGNKLKMAHIRWKRQKMKVKPASQVFSSSVVDALEYRNKHLQLPHFKGCEETVNLLRTIDAAFDALNSRNLLGKGDKAPMRTSNKERAEKILLKAESLLLDLKDFRSVLVNFPRAGGKVWCPMSLSVDVQAQSRSSRAFLLLCQSTWWI